MLERFKTMYVDTAELTFEVEGSCSNASVSNHETVFDSSTSPVVSFLAFAGTRVSLEISLR